jgi:N,N'-diacetyllegionaminate synthase
MSSSALDTFAVAGRTIGPGARCFVIAEAGVNHNGDPDRALAMIDVAADAGVDAVKFQTFDADRLALRQAPKAAYQIEATGPAESQHAMLAALQLSRDDHVALAQRCRERGILFMSTPFDEPSADMLAELDVPVFKLPSGEITNHALLSHVARFGKPLIISTGMATIEEVEQAVLAVRIAGNESFALLHCVSAYPADPHDVNLRAMATMAAAFGVPVGYSDHTQGLTVALAAVALGACIIEKHFTLDRTLPGPDHRASLEPGELAELVRCIRTVESSLGDGRKEPSMAEAATAAVARKSLIAARDIEAGALITDAHLDAKRPGTGLSPALRPRLVGRNARVAISAGTILTWEMLS